MEDLFGLPMSLGHREPGRGDGTDLTAPVAEARPMCKPSLSPTWTKRGGAKASSGLAVDRGDGLGHGLCGARSRGSSRPGTPGGALLGLVVSPIDWSAYIWYPSWRRQLCWAHLLRDIEAMIDRGGPSREIGEALRAQAHQMFHWWHRVRDGTSAMRVLLAICGPSGARWSGAGRRSDVWGPQDGGHLPGDPQAAQALWRSCATRGGADQPMRRAGHSSRRPLAKGSFGTTVRRAPGLSKR